MRRAGHQTNRSFVALAKGCGRDDRSCGLGDSRRPPRTTQRCHPRRRRGRSLGWRLVYVGAAPRLVRAPNQFPRGGARRVQPDGTRFLASHPDPAISAPRIEPVRRLGRFPDLCDAGMDHESLTGRFRQRTAKDSAIRRRRAARPTLGSHPVRSGCQHALLAKSRQVVGPRRDACLGQLATAQAATSSTPVSPCCERLSTGCQRQSYGHSGQERTAQCGSGITAPIATLLLSRTPVQVSLRPILRQAPGDRACVLKRVRCLQRQRLIADVTPGRHGQAFRLGG